MKRLVTMNGGKVPRVILCYKTYTGWTTISHVGLGVAAINKQQVLADAGIRCEIKPIRGAEDLRDFLAADADGDDSITHVVISAPFIPTLDLQKVCMAYPGIVFAFTCHSNTAFLQADPSAVRLIREGMDLEAGVHNFHVAGNSRRFVEWIRTAYGRPCTYLPNLYFFDDLTDTGRPRWADVGGTLKIGIFGATRWQKNFVTAVGAAIIMARTLRAQTEIYINTARADGPETRTIYNAAVEMTRNMPNVRLVPVPWASWPAFREIIGNMHLCMQPSYSETYNIVTVDAVQQGVASVVSDAITWAPDAWKAQVDSAADIARKGIALLQDPRAPRAGLKAAMDHNTEGVAAWRDYAVNGLFGQ